VSRTQKRIAAPDRDASGLERENAELRQQLDEAHAQHAAIAEILQVINASPGDLAPVFDAVLEKAMRLCEAAFGSFVQYDGEHFRAIAHRGVPEELVERLHAPQAPTPGGSFARLLAGAVIIHLADIADDEGYRAGLRGRLAMVDVGGARTAVWVALRKDDALLGTLVLYRQEVRPFTDQQIALLQNFAAQAVIAIENARLITETREALEQQTATADVLQVINSSPGDLAPVFDAILEKAHSLCGVDRGHLMTCDGEHFLAVATHNMPERFAEMLRRPFRAEPGSPNDRLLRGEPFVHIPNLGTAGPLSVSGQAGLEAGNRTVLLVALRKEAALLGYISASRTEVRPFTDQQIALLQNFAAQAVIAIENARLINGTREALEQQTATAEVLQVINASPGELTPVFDAILEKAHSLCGGAYGSLHIADTDAFRAAAVRGMPEEFAEMMRRPARLGPNHPAWRLAEGSPFVQILDAAEVDDERMQAAVHLAGMRTVLFVPLRKDETFVGYIVASRPEMRPFTDKQIALLQNFAAQAVIAMENARLITETREALEQQTATAEVLGVINSSPGNLGPVFDAMLAKAVQLCNFAFAVLWIYDGESFRAHASHATPPAYAEFLAQRAAPVDAGTAFAKLLEGAEIAHFDDVACDTPGTPYGPKHPLAALGGARTYLAVPLRKEGGLLGAISAFRQVVNPFSDKQIALLQNFAVQAVVAMENARLLGELRQRTEEVAELNRGLEARVAEQVEELGRVGKLKRFLPPQLAEMIVSQGDEDILESHRREIVVVFCDLRGYTAFTETAEPEEVLDFLREYHAALGPLVAQFEGTLDHFSGDGIMVFFNDPLPCDDPAGRAVTMAIAMRQAAGGLSAKWRRRGRELGFGVGIAQGYATLGQIGFADRSGYTAIGTVCNLAARLCGEAKDGQILIARRVALDVEDTITLEDIGALSLKGLTQPVAAYNVVETAAAPAVAANQ